jgi:hypothetical protein
MIGYHLGRHNAAKGAGFRSDEADRVRCPVCDAKRGQDCEDVPTPQALRDSAALLRREALKLEGTASAKRKRARDMVARAKKIERASKKRSQA